jgi:heptaprenyl diphosphate synthase
MFISTTREDHLVAWLAALAIVIHVLESALPSPVPGVKPGLANVITVLALMLYGWRVAAWVSVLRVIGGSLLTGTFLSPTFLLSLSGALTSLTVLFAVHAIVGRRLSALGLCVLAAIAHMLGQFLVAYWLIIPHPALLRLLPVLLTVALLFGVVTGTMANRIYRYPTASPT